MSYLKFNHVFFGLMFLAFLSAFVISPRVSSRAQGNVGSLFTPVAAPVRWLCNRAHDKATDTSPRDSANPDHPRSNADVLIENTALRNEVARLTMQLAHMEEVNHERERLSDLRALCAPFKVLGSDAGSRETIAIQGTSSDGLRDGMVALCADGLVGKVSAGVAGARVQLITDTRSTLTVIFGRVGTNDKGGVSFQSLNLPQIVAQGTGSGQLIVRLLPMQAVRDAKLAENDIAILDDTDGWPRAVQSIRVGRVVSIKPRSDSQAHAEIRIEPLVNLMQLKEVMVLTKDKG